MHVHGTCMTTMPGGCTLVLSRRLGQVLCTLHVASTLVNVWGKMITGAIAVCGMLLDVITQSDNHLRGQVRTGLLRNYDLLQERALSLSLISNRGRYRLRAIRLDHAAPPNSTPTASTPRTHVTMRRQSAAEAKGHSRTYSISTVSSFSSLLASTLAEYDRMAPKMSSTRRSKQCFSSSAFRPSAA
jgi:hypothetical protein